MRKPSSYFSKTFLEQVIPYYLETFEKDRTANEYFSYACLLCDYLEKDFLEITELDAQRYYNHLLSKYHAEQISRKTINLRFSSYKRLAGFIHDLNLVPDYNNPFYRIKKITTSDDISHMCIIPWEDLDKIMSAAKDDDMMYLILALASRCAFTLTEIIKLKKSMITVDGDYVYVTLPIKDEYAGTNVRMLSSDVSQLMISYLETATIYSEYGYLFYNQHRNPITARNVDSAVQRIVRNSGVDRTYTIKDFRTKCIIDMKNAGVSNSVVASYVDVEEDRIKYYARAASSVYRTCPANLVNYRLMKGEKQCQ